MIRAGSALGGYRVDGIVGRGATATVYAATELSEARRVALKVLAPHLEGNAGVRERFRETARVQQSLRHPNILEVYDVVESGAEIFLVTPLVGGTLAALIAEGSLTPERVARILRQVADALDFAHGEGIVHGDVKPRNVLVDADDDVAYLTDFGLATAVSRVAPGASASGPATIGYSAPERLRGEPATPSTDLYSLACVLFECVAGVVPFAHATGAAVVGGHLYNAPPRLSELRPGTPPELDDVLASGLAKDARARPRSAGELVEAAEKVLAEMPPAAAAPPASRERRSTTASALEDTLDDPLLALPAPPAIDVSEPSALTRGFFATAAAVLLAAGIAGTLLGHRAGGGADERTFAAGALELEVPAGWRRVSASRFRAFTLERPLALVPSRYPRRVTFLGGLARADPPTFLPRPLLDDVRATPRRALVRLAGGVAFRYAGLPGVGAHPVLWVFVLPGPRVSAVAACASAATGPVLRECASIARTLQIRKGRAYDPTPSARFAAELNSAIHVLRVARGSGLALLAKAASRRAQARSATEIAVAYRTTAASVRRARPTPIARPATDALVAALDRAGVGYTRLAAGARTGNAGVYEDAAHLILRAESDVRAAQTQVTALGYGE